MGGKEDVRTAGENVCGRTVPGGWSASGDPSASRRPVGPVGCMVPKLFTALCYTARRAKASVVPSNPKNTE